MPVPNPVVVTLEGEWDLSRRYELRAQMTSAIERTPKDGEVYVDLTRTAFLDSMTLSVLLNARRRLEQKGGRIITRCTRESFPHRTLERAGLIDTLNVQLV
jgi:anti-anti-sigma factor